MVILVWLTTDLTFLCSYKVFPTVSLSLDTQVLQLSLEEAPTASYTLRQPKTTVQDVTAGNSCLSCCFEISDGKTFILVREMIAQERV